MNSQRFLDVFLSPCCDFHDSIMAVFKAVPPEGPEIAGSQYRFLGLTLKHTDFSRL